VNILEHDASGRRGGTSFISMAGGIARPVETAAAPLTMGLPCLVDHAVQTKTICATSAL